MQSAAAIVDEIHAIRQAQHRESVRLGGIAPTLDQLRAMADAAAQFRELYADLELGGLPQPGPTERPAEYQIKLLEPLQKFSPDWRRTDLAHIARHGGTRALSGIDRAIIADAVRIASDRTVGSFRVPGALRAIRRIDQAGQESIAYYGNPFSWMKAFFPPVVACVEHFVRR